MDSRCFVPYCDSDSVHQPHLQFYSFSTLNLNQWFQAIEEGTGLNVNRSKFNFLTNKICEKHFRQDDFQPHTKSLFSSVIPSVFRKKLSPEEYNELANKADEYMQQLQDKCRICFISRGSFSIASCLPNTAITIIQAVKNTFNIHLNTQSGYSHKVCSTCFHSLTSSHLLKQELLTTESKFIESIAKVEAIRSIPVDQLSQVMNVQAFDENAVFIVKEIPESEVIEQEPESTVDTYQKAFNVYVSSLPTGPKVSEAKQQNSRKGQKQEKRSRIDKCSNPEQYAHKVLEEMMKKHQEMPEEDHKSISSSEEKFSNSNSRKGQKQETLSRINRSSNPDQFAHTVLGEMMKKHQEMPEEDHKSISSSEEKSSSTNSRKEQNCTISKMERQRKISRKGHIQKKPSRIDKNSNPDQYAHKVLEEMIKNHQGRPQEDYKSSSSSEEEFSNSNSRKGQKQEKLSRINRSSNLDQYEHTVLEEVIKKHQGRSQECIESRSSSEEESSSSNSRSFNYAIKVIKRVVKERGKSSTANDELSSEDAPPARKTRRRKK